MSGAPFPRQCVVQVFAAGGDNRHDGLSEDCRAVIEAIKATTSIPIVLVDVPEFMSSLHLAAYDVTKEDLVVGNMPFCKSALRCLGLRVPLPVDYPSCLASYLHRHVWRSTLAQLHALPESRDKSVFIKPAADGKAFSGLIASEDWLNFLIQEVSPSCEIWCSDCVEMTSECRVYVCDGKILALCMYKATADDALLDRRIIEEAVATLCASPEGVHWSAFAADFAVMHLPSGEVVTGLVEVNEAFALGRYDGLAPTDYVKLLATRWKQLMAS